MSTYPVVLPAPCHNGWAKGSGRVHAGSSVGNLSEQSVARRRVKRNVQQIQNQNNVQQDIFKITGAAFFLLLLQTTSEESYITDLCPVPSHKPEPFFFSFPLWIGVKSLLNNMSLTSRKTLSKCSTVIRKLGALCRLTLPPVFTKTLTVPSCFSRFSYLTSAAK